MGSQMFAQTSPTNRLAGEKSPYLLQHQHNPVQWYPWGEEAFAKARAENKPIFLSIGYSTCHWCHVMAHESFESEATAKLMNEHFINIKVDREERPDVDRVYMTYVQATTGSGGWPMSVFLTPKLEPFYGGTYFPPSDRFGRPGFPTLLQRIAQAWEKDHANVVATATQSLAALREHTASGPAGATAGRAEVTRAYEQLASAYDVDWAGFGSAPKFPHPVSLELLLRVYAREGRQSKDGMAALGMVLGTLQKMAAGGMYDHLGGGFHRYSVDRFWHIPHYEKMLYDQAQLVNVYLDAFQITGQERYRTVARETLEYVLRDLTDKAGGFYSAEDADSLLEHGKPEHSEGAFYVWKASEIDALLGEDAALFKRFYGVEPGGNAPEGSDPHGELKGTNTLIQRLSVAELAKETNRPEAEVSAALASARAKLLAKRSERPRPHLDDKIITAWNGLMITAFARAGRVLEEPRYLQAAQRAAQFIRQELWKDGALLRSYRQGASTVPGFADDYAFLIAGLLALYEADFNVQWLQWAVDLQGAMDGRFLDQEHGGYFSVAPGAQDILLRMKEDYDGAEPSPNSIAAQNLAKLAQLTGQEKYAREAGRTLAVFGERVKDTPTAMPRLLCAVEAAQGKPRQIVIAGQPNAADTKALLQEVAQSYQPDTVLLLADGGPGQQWLGERLEFLQTMGPIGGKAAAYVCENFACQLPVTEPAKLREALSK